MSGKAEAARSKSTSSMLPPVTPDEEPNVSPNNSRSRARRSSDIAPDVFVSLGNVDCLFVSGKLGRAKGSLVSTNIILHIL